MSKFYDRRWELLLNDVTFISETAGRQFKMTFNVIVDFGGYVSYADIAIYNLSQDTIGKLFKRNTSVGLRAGYVESIDYIFKGRINNILRERVGPDTITRIIAIGGTQPATQQVNATLGVNSTIVDIIRQCATAMGYPLVIKSGDFSGINPYPRGYSLNGDPRGYLDKLAQAHEFSYVIENDRIVVVGKDSFRDGAPYEVNERNGMQGIPEITENGADVSLRLSPRVRIGGRIDIQSNLATFNFSNLYFNQIPETVGKGIYRVFRLNHTGDTWGDEWTTRVTGFR
ncbi:hypothetical protein VchM-138_0057 [Vibrio phage vB_VchM-138]|uniref:baseplate hub n=1 Tax=Vibrio phage vB_VchM-138 TaxID=1127518 RepID=UPI0002536E26|nr:baseplate hub [Vibrio phage vB_VchM-138]AFC22736.1 hypothetical protein VchM-138_0057 [Vibrio phage vB_VchM-138]